jgi:hypothetical protein
MESSGEVKKKIADWLDMGLWCHYGSPATPSLSAPGSLPSAAYRYCPDALPDEQQLSKIALQPLSIAKKPIFFGDRYIDCKKKPKNLHPLKMHANFGRIYQQIEKPTPSCLLSFRTSASQPSKSFDAGKENRLRQVSHPTIRAVLLRVG